MSIESKRKALRRLKLLFEQTKAETEYMEGLELLMAIVRLRQIHAQIMVVRSTPAHPREASGTRLYIK